MVLLRIYVLSVGIWSDCMSEIVSIFEKYGFAGVVVLVLVWFMNSYSQVVKDFKVAYDSNTKVLVKICAKLGIQDE